MSAQTSPIQALRGWGAAFVDMLYPPVCHLCYRRLAPEDPVICFRCRHTLRVPAQWRCIRCGAHGSAGGPESDGRCRLCPPDDAPYRGILSVIGYHDISARCVHLFKYRRRIELGRVMARLMVEEMADPLGRLGARIECVAPVPLHYGRRLLRGFNQSHLLARALAEASGRPYDARLLRRRRFTRRQALVPREKRAGNVKGAFAMGRRREADGKGVLLVDDVVTTGETIKECARVLMEAGAREVWIACFARARMESPPMGE